jgi:hypothetical protein
MRKFLFVLLLCPSILVLGDTGAEGSDLYLAPAWQYLYNHDKANDLTYQGSMGGLSIGYDYTIKDSVYFNAEFTYMAGSVEHRGWLNKSTQEYITQAVLGYDISSPFGQKFSITPFVGIGAYVFNQSTSAHTFNSNFWYAPIGLCLEYRFNANWALALSGYGAPTFAGHVNNQWIDGQVYVSGLWSVQMPLSYVGSLPFKAALIPFAKQWAYERSGLYEGNRQTYFGLKMAFAYHF